MDWPVIGSATTSESLVEHDDSYSNNADSPFDSIAILARFPNLSQMEETEAEAAGKPWFSQSLRFRLLAGAGMLLVVVAVFTALIGKKGSSSTTDTAKNERPAWQKDVPAPLADSAPRWTPTKTSPQNPTKTPNTTPEKAVAQTGAQPPLPNNTPNTPISSPSAIVLNPPPANTAMSLDSPNNIPAAAAAINSVRQAVVSCVAKANTPGQIAGNGMLNGSAESTPLTWDNFNRQYDALRATVSSKENSGPKENTMPGMQAECQNTPYPATNTPNALILGHSTATTTERDPSDSYRK
jgi:hypothetical protein